MTLPSTLWEEAAEAIRRLHHYGYPVDSRLAADVEGDVENVLIPLRELVSTRVAQLTTLINDAIESLDAMELHGIAERYRAALSEPAPPTPAAPEQRIAKIRARYEKLRAEWRELAHECGEASAEGTIAEGRQAVRRCERKEAAMDACLTKLLDARAADVSRLEARVAQLEAGLRALHDSTVSQAAAMQIEDLLSGAAASLPASGTAPVAPEVVPSGEYDARLLANLVAHAANEWDAEAKHSESIEERKTCLDNVARLREHAKRIRAVMDFRAAPPAAPSSLEWRGPWRVEHQAGHDPALYLGLFHGCEMRVSAHHAEQLRAVLDGFIGETETPSPALPIDLSDDQKWTFPSRRVARDLAAALDALHSWRLSAGLTSGQDAALVELLSKVREAATCKHDLQVGAPPSATETPDEDVADCNALEVLCRVFDDGADEGYQEWLAWYKPEQWLTPSRALGAFIRQRLSVAPPRESPVSVAPAGEATETRQQDSQGRGDSQPVRHVMGRGDESSHEAGHVNASERGAEFTPAIAPPLESPVSVAPAGETLTPVAFAKRFHEAYERLAPSFGYTTREASAKPWAEVPEQNRRLMIAVCAELLGASLPNEPSPAAEPESGRGSLSRAPAGEAPTPAEVRAEFDNLLGELLIWGGHNHDCWHARRLNPSARCFCGWDHYRERMEVMRERFAVGASLPNEPSPAPTEAPPREAIRSALASAIEEAAIWVERAEFNEFNEPDAPEQAKRSREEITTLRWIATHFGVVIEPSDAEEAIHAE